MKEEKISKINKILFPVSILIFLASIAISTYAVYKSSSKGTSELKTADWEITLNNENITTSSTFTFSLSDATWTHKSDINIEGETVQIIAPGSIGTYNLAINAENTEVDVEYSITTTIKQNDTVIDLSTINPNLTVGVYDGDTPKSNPAVGYINAGGSKNLNIKIIWNNVDNEESNESDTGITNNSFVIEVTIVTKQKPYIPTAAQTIGSITTLVEAADAKRYIGADPENYVYFNCTTNNTDEMNDSTCEKWRIIGVYGNNLKILKYTSIGNRQYNSSDNEGNVWEGSNLQKYLNETYYPTLSENSRLMIEEGVWNVGAGNTEDIASTAYTHAKATTWEGKVGVTSLYEYLYAASNTIISCWEQQGALYANGYGCQNNDWIFTNTEVYSWLATPYSGNPSRVISINSAGNTYAYLVHTQYAIYPVVYLNESVIISGGTGSASTPYKLIMQ